MKYYLETLGCDKNRVDAEEMITLLSKDSFQYTADEQEAELIIVNTCCFIDAAKEESIEAILELSRLKTEGSCRYLVVTGCMAQRYKQELLDELPEVDAVIGTTSYDAISDIVTELIRGDSGSRPCLIQPNMRELPRPADRILTTPVHYGYLKIAEGCSKCCTYCIIPSIRGGYRSFDMELLLTQARAMADKGVRELILIAQETTIYGTDLYGEKSLHILLQKLCKIEALDRIRIMYCYPEEIYPELIRTMASEPKICNYVDMPIQHCNDDILKAMGRRVNKQGIIDIVNSLREAMPDVVIRTALITGFPSETDEQHKELISFLKEVRLDHVGVFSYSQEDGTRAAKMPNQISEEVKARRLSELMLTQKEVLARLNEKWIGRELDCLVDGYLYEEDVYVARSYADAPDVDSMIFFPNRSGRSLDCGAKVILRIKDFSDYDFEAEEVDE